MIRGIYAHQVKLKSAYRADSASQTFKEALCLLSKPTPANSGSSSSSGEEDAVMVQVRAGDLELQRSRGRRGSILGRVIWGSDLRKEREARLAAVGSAKASPAPQGEKTGGGVSPLEREKIRLEKNVFARTARAQQASLANENRFGVVLVLLYTIHHRLVGRG